MRGGAPAVRGLPLSRGEDESHIMILFIALTVSLLLAGAFLIHQYNSHALASPDGRHDAEAPADERRAA